MTDKGSVVEALRAALLHGNNISAGDDFVFLDALGDLIPRIEARERVAGAAKAHAVNCPLAVSPKHGFYLGDLNGLLPALKALDSLEQETE